MNNTTHMYVVSARGEGLIEVKYVIAKRRTRGLFYPPIYSTVFSQVFPRQPRTITRDNEICPRELGVQEPGGRSQRSFHLRTRFGRSQESCANTTFQVFCGACLIYHILGALCHTTAKSSSPVTVSARSGTWMLVRDKAARKQWKKDEKLGTFSLMIISVCILVCTRTNEDFYA